MSPNNSRFLFSAWRWLYRNGVTSAAQDSSFFCDAVQRDVGFLYLIGTTNNSALRALRAVCRQSQKPGCTGVAFCADVMMKVLVSGRNGRLKTMGRLERFPDLSVIGPPGLVVEQQNTPPWRHSQRGLPPGVFAQMRMELLPHFGQLYLVICKPHGDDAA